MPRRWFPNSSMCRIHIYIYVYVVSNPLKNLPTPHTRKIYSTHTNYSICVHTLLDDGKGYLLGGCCCWATLQCLLRVISCWPSFIHVAWLGMTLHGSVSKTLLQFLRQWHHQMLTSTLTHLLWGASLTATYTVMSQLAVPKYLYGGTWGGWFLMATQIRRCTLSLLWSGRGRGVGRTDQCTLEVWHPDDVTRRGGVMYPTSTLWTTWSYSLGNDYC